MYCFVGAMHLRMDSMSLREAAPPAKRALPEVP